MHTLQPDAHKQKQTLLREVLDLKMGSSLVFFMTNIFVMLVFKHEAAVQSGFTSEKDGAGWEWVIYLITFGFVLVVLTDVYACLK